jgi:hypothetical protein
MDQPTADRRVLLTQIGSHLSFENGLLTHLAFILFASKATESFVFCFKITFKNT